MTPTWTSKSFQSPLEATAEANACNTPSNGTRRALIGINTVPERSPSATTSTVPESSHKSVSITFNGDIESSESSLVHKEDKAIRRLLESWMERLQLVSVLSIFFASTEATLLSITTPAQGQALDMTILASAANAGLAGGLVLHILAAFISFLAGFFLVRYKIKWAHTERLDMAKKRAATHANYTCDRNPNVPALSPADICFKTNESISPINAPSSLGRKIRKMSGNFCVSRWDEGSCLPFHKRQVPTRLLGRFYFMCVVLTLLGFIFSVTGLVCDAYDRLPSIIGSVAITVISVTLFAVFVIFFLPDQPVGEEIQWEMKETP